ncbi:hypothetical protein GS436_16900 [Rhodococcus hoagii]|nr:hypothetical protein [Prescottella equi]
MTEQTPASGDELAAFYRYKATQAGVILEHDDEVLVEQAAATLDLIAALQRDLDEHGVMLVGATGTARSTPPASRSGSSGRRSPSSRRWSVTVSSGRERGSTRRQPARQHARPIRGRDREA